VISVIIPSYNQGQYLGEAIRSTLEGGASKVEVVVVDGASRDTSVDVLRSFGDRIRWVSEKDEGQADALNKGLMLVTGDVVGWVNADDRYEPMALKSVERLFQESSISWAIGDVANLYEATGELEWIRSETVTLQTLLRNPDIVRQPATFFRREILAAIGGWDKQYNMVMDLDLWVRLCHVHEPLMVPERWAVFRIHPAQKTVGANMIKQCQEMQRILKRERVPFSSRLRVAARKAIGYVKSVLKNVLIRNRMIDERYRTIPYSHRKRNPAR
jgi:glycosyltransferase involved in cell wall biosynthesis